MINYFQNVVVIAPHPDDETLGLGGSIKRLTMNKAKVSILIVSGHLPPLYKKKEFDQTLSESKKVFKHLGVRDYEFLKIPATKVNDLPVATLNKSISKFITDRRPDTVFIPFPDRHIDHRVIFDSSIVACRPVSKNSPKNVFLYETLSETHWNVPNVEPSFNPTVFINIEETIKDKLSALRLYKSQINDTTPSRSLKAVESLAKFRGSQNGCEYAESFQIVRMVI